MEDKLIREELLARLRDGVVSFDGEQVKTAAAQALAEGLEAHDAVVNGLVPGLEQVIILYDDREYFLPELLMSADAATEGLEIFRSSQPEKSTALSKAAVLVCDPQEKIENLSRRMLNGACELGGVDFLNAGPVVNEDFIKKSLRPDLELVIIPSLIIRTEPDFESIVDAVRRRCPKARFVLCGSPATDDPIYWLDPEDPDRAVTSPVREAMGAVAVLARWLAERRELLAFP